VQSKPGSSEYGTRLIRTTTAIFDRDSCIVCLKKSYKQDRKLYKFATIDIQKNLRQAANVRKDEEILICIGSEDGPDLIAAATSVLLPGSCALLRFA
jgi:hypothetical protein